MENIPTRDTETYMINGRPLYPNSDNIWESPPISLDDIDHDPDWSKSEVGLLSNNSQPIQVP